jgi:hypothetical protein
LGNPLLQPWRFGALVQRVPVREKTKLNIKSRQAGVFSTPLRRPRRTAWAPLPHGCSRLQPVARLMKPGWGPAAWVNFLRPVGRTPAGGPPGLHGVRCFRVCLAGSPQSGQSECSADPLCSFRRSFRRLVAAVFVCRVVRWSGVVSLPASCGSGSPVAPCPPGPMLSHGATPRR